MSRWFNAEFIYLSRPTVTLHKGQGHQNKYEHIGHRIHKAAVIPSLNVIAYILSEILQIECSQVGDALTNTHTDTQTRVVYLKICKCRFRKLWPCIKVTIKVIETSICHTQVYRYAKFECHSLNIVRDITNQLQVKTV